MALGVEVSIERMFLGARGVVGDDGERAFGGDGLAELVGVIGGVGQPKPLTARWILVLRPPRERPMA